MSSVPLSNVLLPAVVISSAVFSTLTVPFALIKSEPVFVEIPPFFSGEIQPIFNGQHKDVAIPYVGFAIVVSVGAGIASVEVNRRWQAYRESAQAQKPLSNIPQNSPEKDAQPEEQELPEYRPEVSAIDLSSNDELFRSSSLTAPDIITEAENIDIETPEPVFDDPELVEPQLTTPEQTAILAAVFEKTDLPQVALENGARPVQPASSEISSQSSLSELDLAFNQILESRQQYETCRIKVPHLKRSLFAIEVNGQYYSFLRAEPTQEKVLEVMAKLGSSLQKTVITKTVKGYVIWAFEPEVSSKL
jgi:hypothetical protein